MVLSAQKLHFKAVGMLIAMSILQGGPGLPILSHHVYTYMATKKYSNLKIEIKDVPDIGVQKLLNEVL